MNRLGFLPAEEDSVSEKLSAIEGVKVMGAVTHFANAEPSYANEKPASVPIQLTRMAQINPAPNHLCMANSAATCGTKKSKVMRCAQVWLFTVQAPMLITLRRILASSRP